MKTLFTFLVCTVCTISSVLAASTAPQLTQISFNPQKVDISNNTQIVKLNAKAQSTFGIQKAYVVFTMPTQQSFQIPLFLSDGTNQYGAYTGSFSIAPNRLSAGKWIMTSVVLTDTQGTTITYSNTATFYPTNTITILEVIFKPHLKLSASPTQITEGGQAVYTVTISSVNPNAPTTISYTMKGNAVLGKHYVLDGTYRQVTIPAGASSATVTLTALITNLTSGNEQAQMHLENLSNFQISNNDVSVTIINSAVPTPMPPTPIPSPVLTPTPTPVSLPTPNVTPTPNAAIMISPSPGSTFTSSSVTFTWSAGSATGYFLLMGSSPNSSDIYDSGFMTALSKTVNNIPTDGRTVYVLLGSEVNAWIGNSYTYKAFKSSATPTPTPTVTPIPTVTSTPTPTPIITPTITPPPILTPTPTPTSNTVTFAWNPPVDWTPTGYNFYYGTYFTDPVIGGKAVILNQKVSLGNVTIATFSLPDSTERAFGVRAFDGNGNESDISNIVNWPNPVALKKSIINHPSPYKKPVMQRPSPKKIKR